MDAKTANKCTQITSEFYKEVNDSFSETRQNPWAGWGRAFSKINLSNEFKLLDLACGNMRFEKFLEERKIVPKMAVCVDNCEEFSPRIKPSFDLNFIKLDLLKDLEFKDSAGLNFSLQQNLFKSEQNDCSFMFPSLARRYLSRDAEGFDLVVCFGFFHHIPTSLAREQFYRQLISFLAPKAYLIISFWEFMKDERIGKKAIETTSRAKKLFDLELDENDYFLSWKDNFDVFRYCHNFSEDEVLEFVNCKSKVDIVDSFLEDGKNHNLNRYVVLRRK